MQKVNLWIVLKVGLGLFLYRILDCWLRLGNGLWETEGDVERSFFRSVKSDISHDTTEQISDTCDTIFDSQHLL